jgi:exosome complex component RRP4
MEKENIQKETEMNEISENKKREIVVPGEVIATGTTFLPGENTKREDEDIIATRFGLLDKEGRLVKVIPLSGIYLPRKGNIVIGKVEDITFNGWLIDIGSPYKSFLPISECQGFISKREDLSTIFAIGELLIALVTNVKAKGIDLTMRDRGLHKIESGITITINSSKVPRVIGKQGSMVSLIKQETGCNIVVGQNGIVWIRGDDIEQELLAKEAIKLITEKSFVEGLTEMVKEFLEKNKKKELKKEKEKEE